MIWMGAFFIHKRYARQITKTKAETKNDYSATYDKATWYYFGTRKSDEIGI